MDAFDRSESGSLRDDYFNRIIWLGQLNAADSGRRSTGEDRVLRHDERGGSATEFVGHRDVGACVGILEEPVHLAAAQLAFGD
jgi:hypothetical protein